MWLDPLGWKGVTVLKASKGFAFDFILKLDSSVYPETAQHIKDAIASGKPSVVTIDRKGAAGRRKEALKGTKMLKEPTEISGLCRCLRKEEKEQVFVK